MVPAIENGHISEPELIDFITGYKKLIKTGYLNGSNFEHVIGLLGVQIGEKGEIILDENNIYTLSE